MVISQRHISFWLGVIWASGLPSVSASATPNRTLPSVIASLPTQPNQSLTCPSDVETLTTEMLRDLPSYANRVSQSARRRNRIVDVYVYILLAGHPEFTPLPLGTSEYIPTPPTKTPQPEPQQVFITTLERQYTAGKVIELQEYHWLFLTQTTDGWQLSLIFSRTGTYPSLQPPTPPQDSSNGVIAQAIRIWLRDCQAGTVRSPNK